MLIVVLGFFNICHLESGGQRTSYTVMVLWYCFTTFTTLPYYCCVTAAAVWVSWGWKHEWKE